ncbi:MAG: hypothetical protein J6N44_03675 [Acidaminococcaceae bacterium]|nr:hypothetical protein [Acidaminococcaceae bacterium]
MSNLMVYEITDQDESTKSKIYSYVRPFVPSNIKEGVVLGLSAATGIASIRIASIAVGAYAVYKESQAKAKKIRRDVLENRFVNAKDNNWVDSQYYIQHPKRKRANYLIEADSFIQYIEDERIGEILDYLRRKGRFNQIKITSKNKNGFKGKAKAGNFSIPFLNKEKGEEEKIDVNVEVEAKEKTEIITKIVYTCDKLPTYDPTEKVDYVWIDSFKKLKALVEGCKGDSTSEIKVTEKFVNDFTIDASFSAMIKLDFNIETDKSYDMIIEAKRTSLTKRRNRNNKNFRKKPHNEKNT